VSSRGGGEGGGRTKGGCGFTEMLREGLGWRTVCHMGGVCVCVCVCVRVSGGIPETLLRVT